MNWTLIALIALPILFLIAIYNSLVGKKNQVLNAFASIDTLLKKRYDLIPNLVEAVKNYMQHERGTLTQITELRSQALSPKLSDSQKIDLNNKISKVLSGILVAVENYPNLKANENFLQLQAALNEVEEQISAARRAYNAAVTDYNNAIQMFPTNMVASLMAYKDKPFFETAETERQNVNVGELFKK